MAEDTKTQEEIIAESIAAGFEMLEAGKAAEAATGKDDFALYPRGYEPGTWKPGDVARDDTYMGPYGPGDIDPQFATGGITYISGQGAQYWNGFSPEMRKRFETQMVNAGLLSEGNYEPGVSSIIQQQAWEKVLGFANYYGVSQRDALDGLERQGIAFGVGRGGGGGAARRTVTTIPDYETLAQNAKSMLQRTLGREINDWEVSLTADEMQKQFRKQSQQQLSASLAGSGEFEITDPGATTQAFINDQYSNELDRLTSVGEQGANYKLAMDVFTKGARMVPS